MANHFTYDEYEFDTEPPRPLVMLMDEYDEIFNEMYVWQDVDGAWRLDKPVSRLEIRPDPSHDEVVTFLEEFSAYFHWVFDGYFLYFSRFPDLADSAARCDTPAIGILFGYEERDVAQYLVERDGAFIGEPNRGEHTVGREAIVRDREACRDELDTYPE